MDLILNFFEGTDHDSLLKRVDFRNISGALSVDMGIVPFFKPATLAILFGIFRLHSHLYPKEKRKCRPSSFKSSDTDVNRYVQRVNFFESCPDFKSLGEEKFSRYDPSGRFVPITVVNSLENTDSAAEKIVKVIFSQTKVSGEAEVKYALTELMDNALQHAQSPIGCVVQTQLYTNNFVEGIILDCGMGIRKHLSGNRVIASQITSDEKAIEKALQPYISGTHNRPKNEEKTRYDGLHNAGLGLSVCSKLMSLSGGFLQIVSGESSIKVTSSGIQKMQIAGWPGTLIAFSINYQKLAEIPDIIKEFDILKTTGHNLEKGSKGPEFV